jgi:hypothetical protein
VLLALEMPVELGGDRRWIVAGEVEKREVVDSDDTAGATARKRPEVRPVGDRYLR